MVRRHFPKVQVLALVGAPFVIGGGCPFNAIERGENRAGRTSNMLPGLMSIKFDDSRL